MKTFDEAVKFVLPINAHEENLDLAQLQHPFVSDIARNNRVQCIASQAPLTMFMNDLVLKGLEQALANIFLTGFSLGVSIGVQMEKQDET